MSATTSKHPKTFTDNYRSQSCENSLKSEKCVEKSMFFKEQYLSELWRQKNILKIFLCVFYNWVTCDSTQNFEENNSYCFWENEKWNISVQILCWSWQYSWQSPCKTFTKYIFCFLCSGEHTIKSWANLRHFSSRKKNFSCEMFLASSLSTFLP